MSRYNLGRYAIQPLRSGFFPALRQRNPQVLWIGCSDSSEGETAALGLDPGEMIVLRNLGNMIIENDLSCVTMLRYAVDHLDVNHIVVCGHYGCGLVKTASNQGLEDPWSSVLDALRCRHSSDLDRLPSPEQDRYMVLLNVMEQARAIRRDISVANAMQKRDLMIHTLLYDRVHDSVGRVVEVGG
ncbi:hypothetical protein FE257_004113 [Aspergillus nanangensis]|uniref:Carbonic anhydrase n=1 Tax=Aspergillus nanangensis TaxID=2582783 RepID=A0AAD4GMG9_ASPNN|nr:hypothetical protein FE257_004113 [Aspergillus nanangensis]